jgi:hypothetical protein
MRLIDPDWKPDWMVVLIWTVCIAFVVFFWYTALDHILPGN